MNRKRILPCWKREEKCPDEKKRKAAAMERRGKVQSEGLTDVSPGGHPLRDDGGQRLCVAEPEVYALTGKWVHRVGSIPADQVT